MHSVYFIVSLTGSSLAHISLQFPMHPCIFSCKGGPRESRPVSGVLGIPRSDQDTSDIANSAPISANWRVTSRSLHSRYQSAYVEVDRWSTLAGARRARRGIPTHGSASVPLFARVSLPPSLRTAMIAPSCRPAWPTLALHQSPINLGLAAVGSRG